jgi:hypothetical protein
MRDRACGCPTTATSFATGSMKSSLPLDVHAWSIPFQYTARPYILYRRRYQTARE